MVEFVSMEPCGHPAGYVCNACVDGIRWFPEVRVDKYSVDQTSFAERKLADAAEWGRRVEVKASGLLTSVMHGDWLRELFPEPEDGIATDYGNSLVNDGLTSLVFLLFNSIVAGSGQQFKTGVVSGASFQTGGTVTTGVGVGVDVTAFSVAHTRLANTAGESSAASWYQQMDATYPQWQGSGTPGQLNGQATFVSANGVFAWNEWCWLTGTGLSAGGSATIAGVGTAPKMLNRKVTSLGTKGAGASWVFSQTVTFS